MVTPSHRRPCGQLELEMTLVGAIADPEDTINTLLTAALERGRGTRRTMIRVRTSHIR